MKANKKVNPYEKKNKRKIKISRKQWTAILSLLGVVAILAGIIVMSGLGGGSHAGHNHGDEGNTTATDEHGHPIGSHDTAPTDAHGHPAGSHGSTLRYQSYANADKTYSYAIYNSKGAELLKKDKLTFEGKKLSTTGDLTEVYFQTAASGFTSGESVFCDEKNERVSEAFHGVLGRDGTRVAYCSDDDTKVIVQDIFDKKSYYKEYPLNDVVNNGYSTVQNATLSQDKKSVSVTYTIDEEGGTRRATIYLHE